MLLFFFFNNMLIISLVQLGALSLYVKRRRVKYTKRLVEPDLFIIHVAPQKRKRTAT